MRGRARVLECVHSLLKPKPQNRMVRAGGLKWRMENDEWVVWGAVYAEDRETLRTGPYGSTA